MAITTAYIADEQSGWLPNLCALGVGHPDTLSPRAEYER